MKARGWTTGAGFDKDNIEVSLRNVCTCRQRHKCRSEGRCVLLFEGGGSLEQERVLRALMQNEGKKMPRSWANGWRNNRRRLSTYEAKEAVIEGFEREYFKACKPVTVEVKGR